MSFYLKFFVLFFLRIDDSSIVTVGFGVGSWRDEGGHDWWDSLFRLRVSGM